jgi:hypothetical protein
VPAYLADGHGEQFVCLYLEDMSPVSSSPNHTDK